MKKIKNTVLRAAMTVLASSMALFTWADTVIELSDYGVRPGMGRDMAPVMERALTKIAAKHGKKDITLRFKPGRYEFYPEKAASRTYFISNHDQPNPKAVGLDLRGWDNLTVDGCGAELRMHGVMLPVALVESSHCTLKDFSIDFPEPMIAQVRIDSVTARGTYFTPECGARFRTDSKGYLTLAGRGWERKPNTGIAFDEQTRHITFNTSDLWCPLDSVTKLGKTAWLAPRWKDRRLKPGTRVALRTWARPAPGIFLSLDKATAIKNVTVHYADGMGLLAQMCDSVSLDGFRVALRGDDDPRYFTTQADATHFSGCKGHIESVNGFYEGMMDDAINVHGTYLKIVKVTGPNSVRARYMHAQTYGFFWGEAGDSVQFVESRIMQNMGQPTAIASIAPASGAQLDGAKEFDITFTTPLPQGIDPEKGFGIENLTWSPTVRFSNNTVRNNRARGSLFSTPRHTEVTDNTFDHTSGTAILLCGDCNGWYETGACRDVLIKGNRFINALTNMFQFTEAVISIYPEIPQLEGQTEQFHGGDSAPGIVITDNLFETFDRPLLFAKSVNGLTFRGNRVTTRAEYPAFHRNHFTFNLLNTKNVTIEDNSFDHPEQVSVAVR